MSKNSRASDGQKRFIPGNTKALKVLAVALVVATAGYHLYPQDTEVQQVSTSQQLAKQLDVKEWKVEKQEGKKGYVDATGQWVIPAEYHKAFSFATNGLAQVEKNGEWGFINAKNEAIIPIEYDSAYAFAANGLAPVEKSGKWGFINTKNQLVIPLGEYDDLYAFSDSGLAAVKKDGKWFYINAKNEIVLPIDANNVPIAFIANGLAEMKKMERSTLLKQLIN